MRRLAAAAAVVLASVALAACAGGGGSNNSSSSGNGSSKPVTITFWTGFTQRELGVIKNVVSMFEQDHPNIHVKVVGGISDDKIVAAIRGGSAGDVIQSFSSDNTGAFCSSGAWIDLAPYMQKDGINENIFPPAPRAYTKYKDTRCSLPMLADVYGLYYNKALLQKAGITSPPKTMSELAADAVKLTTHKSDGSIDVLGFDPVDGFYENAAAHWGPLFGATWVDASGKSILGAQPGWAQMLTWQRDLINKLGGYSALVKWQSGAGDEFSPQQAFERGKLAMNMDGEWRVAFIKAEHPELDYGTAPMPVADNHPELYGSGYTTGNIVGIPKTSSHKDEAWELLKYLTTDDRALAALANGILNVPTTTSSLHSPLLKLDPKFKVFLSIFGNPNTKTTPITLIGSANQELFDAFVTKYQSGKTSDIQGGLKNVDGQIEAQLQNASGGQVP